MNEPRPTFVPVSPRNLGLRSFMSAGTGTGPECATELVQEKFG